jgi:hypothetical protein
MAWRAASSSEEDVSQILGPTGNVGDANGAERVHAVEYGWLETMREVQLYAYRFAESEFRPFGNPDSPHAMVCGHEVTPLGPAERVADLFALHDEAGIELRVLPNLWPFWDRVAASTLDFSAVRLRNARPRPA